MDCVSCEGDSGFDFSCSGDKNCSDADSCCAANTSGIGSDSDPDSCCADSDPDSCCADADAAFNTRHDVDCVAIFSDGDADAVLDININSNGDADAICSDADAASNRNTGVDCVAIFSDGDADAASAELVCVVCGGVTAALEELVGVVCGVCGDGGDAAAELIDVVCGASAPMLLPPRLRGERRGERVHQQIPTHPHTRPSPTHHTAPSLSYLNVVSVVLVLRASPTAAPMLLF